MKCCPTGSRQLCIRKTLAQCFPNTLGTLLHRSKPYAMLPERLQTTLHQKNLWNVVFCKGHSSMQCCLESFREHCIRKNPVQCCLKTIGTTLHSWKPFPMLSKRLETTLHKKKLCAIFPVYSLHNIAQVRTLCNAVWLQTTLHNIKSSPMLP